MALLVCAVLCAAPAVASADWYFTPFVGMTFAPKTTLVDLDRSAGSKKATWGASAMLLSDGLLGIEADFGHTPGFFQTQERVVLRSRVLTLGGNIVIAAPLSVTRESLRPYIIGGVSWLSAGNVDLFGVFPVERQSAAVALGGGLIGMLNERAGVRFDVRRFSDISGGEPVGLSFGSPKLSFWRASIGVTIK
jgi:hypothetical protein